MAQVDNYVNIGVSQEFMIWGSNVAVGLTGSFANVLVLDNLKKIRKVVIHIGDDDVSIAEDYQIFVTNNPAADTSDLTTDDWFEKVASTNVTAGDTKEEIITESYAKIVVQMKAASGTPTATLYYRGTS